MNVDFEELMPPASQRISRPALVKPQTSSQDTQSVKVTQLPGTVSLEKSAPISVEDEKRSAEDLAQELHEYAQDFQRSIQFSVNEKSGRTTITVSDKETGDIIREIPSEAIQAIQAHIRDIREDMESDKSTGVIFSDFG